MGASYGKLMMVFYRIRCFNVLWILAAYGFLDLNLLKHGYDEVFTHFRLCMEFLLQCIM
jgi:hypothetical protein